MKLFSAFSRNDNDRTPRIFSQEINKMEEAGKLPSKSLMIKKSLCSLLEIEI